MSLSDNRGSSPIEFLLIGLPMMFCAVLVFQISSASYQKDVALDAAIEAAAFASLADQTSAAAEAHAKTVLDLALPQAKVSVDSKSILLDDAEATEVTIKLNQVGLFIDSLQVKAIGAHEIQNRQ